jgi:hypothetical protein
LFGKKVGMKPEKEIAQWRKIVNDDYRHNDQEEHREAIVQVFHQRGSYHNLPLTSCQKAFYVTKAIVCCILSLRQNMKSCPTEHCVDGLAVWDGGDYFDGEYIHSFNKELRVGRGIWKNWTIDVITDCD